MSPLVRSLLALAAMLATAATQDPPGCTIKIFGEVTPIPVPLQPVYVPPPGAIIDILDYCPSRVGPGYQRVGELVKACNKDPLGAAPLVFENPDGQLEYVDVVCPDGCPLGVDVDVTEYCRLGAGAQSNDSEFVYNSTLNLLG